MHIDGGVSPDQSGPPPGPRDASTTADGARIRLSVLGAPIDVTTWRDTMNRLSGWARNRESRTVLTCNVHSVISARTDPVLREAIETADHTTADGMPVAWFLSLLRRKRQERIAGPDLMWHYCGEAAGRGEAIFLLGSTPDTLTRLEHRLSVDFPGLRVVGRISPPYGDWSPALEQRYIDEINAAGTQVLFVGLGCPKQEIWIHHQRGRIQAVMVGVGAAFDFYAGTVRRAPLWMQKSGLEWTWRLAREPRRLFGRYFTTNSLFLLGALRQLVRGPSGPR